MTTSPFSLSEGVALLRTYLGSERRDLLSLLVFSALAGGLSLVFPLTAQVLINQVASGAVLQSLFVLALLLLAGLAAFTWLEAARFSLVEFVGRRLFVRRARRFAERLARANDAKTSAHDRVELANRFFDTVTADKTLQVLLFDGVSAVLGALAGMALLALYHPALLGFDLLLIIAVLLPLLMMPAGLRAAYGESTAKYRVVAWLEEVAASSTWPRASGGNVVAGQHLDTLVDEWLGYRSDHFRVTFRQYLCYLIVQALGTVGLLVIGGLLVIEGQLSLGQLVAAELVVTGTVAAIARIGKLLPKVYDLLVALKKVDAVEGDLELESIGGGVLQGTGAMRVELSEVVLRAGGAPQDFIIEPGGLLALRPSVEAFATLDLLFGLRAPLSGVALFEGLPLADLSRACLRDRVGYVDGADVPAGSVEDNLRLADPDATTAQLWRALDSVGLRPRLLELGGLTFDARRLDDEEQTQLAIARELLREPALLLIRGIDLLPTAGFNHVARALCASTATRVIVTNDPERFQDAGTERSAT